MTAARRMLVRVVAGWLVPVAMAALSGAAAAASFNCAKAGTDVERRICKSAQLSGLDDELAAAYKAAYEGSADKDPLVVDQGRWLKLRDRCLNDTCLQTAYRQRIGVLRAWHEDAAPNANVFGRYQLTRANAIYNGDTKDWDPTRTTDCMTLAPGKGKTVRFLVNLVQTNGHSCWLDGSMARDGAVFTYLPDPAEPDFAECKLTLRVKRQTIEITDPEGACRPHACGARASFDNSAFLRAARDQGACKL